MLTYQDYEAAADKTAFVQKLISEHKGSDIYRTAVDADAYDHQKNTFILSFISEVNKRRSNPYRQDIKIPCNLFHRLNKQRCSYLLGNGIGFTRKEERAVDGKIVKVDVTREALGSRFDSDVYYWGYHALIHGVAFGYWTPGRIYVYPVTGFAPLWDEETGNLRAGARFWRIAGNKPLYVELYTEEGIYSYRSETGNSDVIRLTDENPTPYLLKIKKSEARGEQVVGEANYATLPVIPMYGSNLKQSTLVGIKARIDAIDMVESGFARDVRDCAKIYWLMENCGDMSDAEMDKFLDDILERHIAKVDAEGSFGGDAAKNHLTPYVQDVPYNSSTAYLKHATEALFQDFGALDVHAIGANSTNDHLDAAFQPLDEEADEFEREVSKAIKMGLELMGIDDDPQYKRNRIINEKERTDMILAAANLLGQRKTLEKLPFIDVDEVDEIMADEFANAQNRISMTVNPQTFAEALDMGKGDEA